MVGLKLLVAAKMAQQHKKMLEQTENVAYITIISLKMKCPRKPKFYSYSSIQLCISCYAGNGDKGNANITNGFICTWQAPNRTTAARTSLLCEFLETDRRG